MNKKDKMQDNVEMVNEQQLAPVDELTEIQNSLLRYVKKMTKVIGQIELNSGLFPV